MASLTALKWHFMSILQEYIQSTSIKLTQFDAQNRTFIQRTVFPNNHNILANLICLSQNFYTILVHIGTFILCV